MVALQLRNTEKDILAPRKARRVFDHAVRSADPALREHHANCVEDVAVHRSREAFAELFSYYAPRVKGFMLRLGASDTEAEELAQEVMVTLWQKAGMYDRRQASVSTWIFRIARNRRIDASRRKKSRPELPADDPMLLPPDIPRPDEVYAREQEDETVRSRLSCLPPDQLILVQAAFYDGLTHSEIAKSFNLPLGTVKSRIRLAFSRLRGELEGAI